MGYGSDSGTRCTTCRLSTSISKPPGARCSARSFPLTIMEDSCVRFLMVSNSSSGRALFTATHCITPEPSRTMGKAILPDRRRLYSQPAISTLSPVCLPASAMVIRVMLFVRAVLLIFQPFENLHHPLQRMGLIVAILQFQQQGILVLVAS